MTRSTATQLLVALGLGLSPLASCSCGLTCGPGTADTGGKCLPVGPLTCGEGTEAQNGACVPQNQVACGPGTEETAGVCLPIGSFTPAPAASDVRLPFDAAPSPDGSVIYYTASGSDGETHSLWSVPFDGSAPATELATGFVAPLGIAVSTDGATVFVGDTGDEADANTDVSGALYSVDASSGAQTRIAAVDGFVVKGLDLVDDNGSDVITFSATDPADGAKGIFKLAANAVTVIAKGAPFDDPSGVAVAASGDRYVVDTSAGDDGNGAVIKVGSDGVAAVFIGTGLHVGYPAGAALSLDEKTLFVSGLDASQAAQVYAIDVAAGTVTTVNSGLAGNDEAGGLHRAKGSDAYAWAGVHTVYGITFQ